MISRTATLTTFILFATAAHADSIDTSAIVAAHNKLRAEAGVSAQLSYSRTLARSAQNWANYLKRTYHCQMHHSQPQGRYGENIFWSSALIWSDGRKETRKIQPAEVINSWGSEKANYDDAANACINGTTCGHYTQIIWHSTSEVGCGMAVCSDTREQIWVCHYAPAGNITGERPY